MGNGNVKMHETEIVRLDERGRPAIERTRVPGGWIYTTTAINQRISTVFVPIMENIETVDQKAEQGKNEPELEKTVKTGKQTKKEV